MDKNRASKKLVFQVGAGLRATDVAMLLARLARRLASCLTLKRVGLDQLAITQLRPRRADHPVNHAERGHGLAQAGRGQIQKERTRLCRRLLHRRCAVGHGKGTRCDTFVWHQRGIAGHDPDTREFDVEFIGADLGERGEDALPQLDFAKE